MKKCSSDWEHTTEWECRGRQYAVGWQYLKGSWKMLFLIDVSPSIMMFLDLLPSLSVPFKIRMLS